MCTESALNGNLGVVKDDTAGNTAIILEGSDNGIQKAFQILPLIGDDIRGAAVTQPGAEQVKNQLLAIDINGSLPPSQSGRLHPERISKERRPEFPSWLPAYHGPDSGQRTRFR